MISFIIPTLNEEKYLLRCLLSIKSLNLGNNKIEIIIVDAGSIDNTLSIARVNRCLIVNNKHRTVGWARYLGFKKSKGLLICFVDADCLLDKNWLLENLKLIKKSNVGGVGGSTLSPSNENNFGKTIDFVTGFSKKFTNTVHTSEYTLKEVTDLPGSNCLYKRIIINKVMPVALNLLTADDVILNYKIKKLGYRLLINPMAKAFHYRRSNILKLFIQFYRFSIGRVQVGRIDKKLIGINHMIAGLIVPLSLMITPLFLLEATPFLLKFLNLSIFFFFFLIIVISFFKSKSIIISFYTPLVIIDMLLGWSIGFCRELFFPIKINK